MLRLADVVTGRQEKFELADSCPVLFSWSANGKAVALALQNGGIVHFLQMRNGWARKILKPAERPELMQIKLSPDGLQAAAITSSLLCIHMWVPAWCGSQSYQLKALLGNDVYQPGNDVIEAVQWSASGRHAILLVSSANACQSVVRIEAKSGSYRIVAIRSHDRHLQKVGLSDLDSLLWSPPSMDRPWGPCISFLVWAATNRISSYSMD